MLRALEDYLRSNKVMDLTAITSGEVALYILNNKREYLNDIERRFGVRLGVVTDERMQGSSFTIERIAPEARTDAESNVVVQMDWGFEAPVDAKAESEDERKNARRKRRRGRNARKEEGEDAVASVASEAAEEMNGEEAEAETHFDNSDEAQRARKSRRRGRRGGRRQRARREGGSETGESDTEQSEADQPYAAGESRSTEEEAVGEAQLAETASAEAGPAGERAAPETADVLVHPRVEGAADALEIGKAESPSSEGDAQTVPSEGADGEVVGIAMEQPPAAGNDAISGMSEAPARHTMAEAAADEAEVSSQRNDQRPRRRGWWQRR